MIAPEISPRARRAPQRRRFRLDGSEDRGGSLVFPLLRGCERKLRFGAKGGGLDKTAGNRCAWSGRPARRCRRRGGRVREWRASIALLCWARPALPRLPSHCSSFAWYENSAALWANLSGKARQSEFERANSEVARDAFQMAGSGFAWVWQNFSSFRGILVWRGDHQQYGSENNGGGKGGAQRDGFARSQPAEKERDDGVYKGVG